MKIAIWIHELRIKVLCIVWSYSTTHNNCTCTLPSHPRPQAHADTNLYAERYEHEDSYGQRRSGHSLYVSLQLRARSVFVHVLVELPYVAAPVADNVLVVE